MSQLDGCHSLDDIPACRHADGTISSSSVLDVWRMASEDSDEVVSGLPSVHRFSDPCNLDHAVDRLVTAGGDELDASHELLEVVTLRCTQWMLLEERNDHFLQLTAPSHDITVQIFAMVVVPPIRDHLTDAEELTKLMEDTDALRALRHRELVSNLVTEPVADSTRPVLLPNKADGEAPFSVYEADHPATELDQPFLLVCRTRHVVTMVNVRPDATR